MVNRQLSNGLKLNRQPSKVQTSINRQNGSVYSADFYGLLTSDRGGGGGWCTPLQEANGDVPLDGADLSDFNGVALSIEILGWGRKFSDFWGK